MKRLIIVGMPRCGTTLLASVLNAQQRATLITDYITGFHGATQRLQCRYDEPLTLAERRVALAIIRDEFLRLRHAVLVKAGDFTTIDELHRLVLCELAEPDSRLVGHKMLLRAADVQKLLDETPIHCVLMYRDPRDAALSYWHRTGEGVEWYLADYKSMLRLSRRLEGHPRFTAIRYESMIVEPARALAPLARAFELEINPNVGALKFRRGPPERQVPWAENSAFGDVSRSFDRAPLERWREHLSSPVVRYAAWTCRRELLGLGYAPLPKATLRLRERARFAGNAAVAAADRRLLEAAQHLSKMLRQRTLQPIRHT